MDAIQPPSRESRLRRWLIGIGIALLLLAVYGVALDWFAQRIGTDVAKTMHALPGVEDDRHRAPGH